MTLIFRNYIVNTLHNWTRCRLGLSISIENTKHQHLLSKDTKLFHYTHKIILQAIFKTFIHLHCGQKKLVTLFHFAGVSTNTDHLLRLFGAWYTELICNKTIIDFPASPMYCCDTTFWNIFFQQDNASAYRMNQTNELLQREPAVCDVAK